MPLSQGLERLEDFICASFLFCFLAALGLLSQSVVSGNVDELSLRRGTDEDDILVSG